MYGKERSRILMNLLESHVPKGWIRKALAPDHQLLIEPTQTEIAHFREAARKHLALGSTEGCSLSQMFHNHSPA